MDGKIPQTLEVFFYLRPNWPPVEQARKAFLRDIQDRRTTNFLLLEPSDELGSIHTLISVALLRVWQEYDGLGGEPLLFFEGTYLRASVEYEVRGWCNLHTREGSLTFEPRLSPTPAS